MVWAYLCVKMKDFCILFGENFRLEIIVESRLSHAGQERILFHLVTRKATKNRLKSIENFIELIE